MSKVNKPDTIKLQRHHIIQLEMQTKVKVTKYSSKYTFVSSGDKSVVVGVSIGLGALLLAIMGALALFFKRRRSQAAQESRDRNPVYATYEISADPVAEVKYIDMESFMIVCDPLPSRHTR